MSTEQTSYKPIDLNLTHHQRMSAIEHLDLFRAFGTYVSDASPDHTLESLTTSFFDDEMIYENSLTFMEVNSVLAIMNIENIDYYLAVDRTNNYIFSEKPIDGSQEYIMPYNSIYINQKQQFRPGDWIVNNGNIYKVNHTKYDRVFIEETVYVRERDCTKWEPTEGQLCFVVRSGLICVISYNEESHSQLALSPCPDDTAHFLPN